ncbi:Ig-like domain-containing protein [Curtobacterium sp. MCJR17_043]|nr:Ig-like domain-containing protein [Curtobacterium sp. MCJR17_043]WIB36530.1 Ig-like domain-containing protein [Curtobacterium sp. MCJR17_043]
MTVDVQANDHGTGLTTAVVSQPAHGTVAVGTDGTVQYSPVAGSSGTDSFTYTVTDAAGQTTGPVVVTITVTPVATADTAGGKAGQTVTIAAATLLGNDAGTGLTVTKVTGAAHGTATLGADGSVVYTPAAGFSGTETLTYTVTDASRQTTTATITVLVGPMAMRDSATVTAGSTLTVPKATGVLANDRGSDLTATVDQRPAHGTLALAADGSYTYTPADGFSGKDTFTYTATDGSGTPATGLVTVTVKPSTGDDTLTTVAGQSLVVTSGGPDRQRLRRRPDRHRRHGRSAQHRHPRRRRLDHRHPGGRLLRHGHLRLHGHGRERIDRHRDRDHGGRPPWRQPTPARSGRGRPWPAPPARPACSATTPAPA